MADRGILKRVGRFHRGAGHAGLSGSYLEGPFTFSPTIPCGFQADFRPFRDPLSLELSECGENAEDQLPLSSGRVNHRLLTC